MINEEQGFMDHVIDFFMDNADVYRRYAGHYWEKVKTRLMQDKNDIEQLNGLKEHLQKDLAKNEKNEGGKYPYHFIITNRNYIKDTIYIIDGLLKKK